MKQIIFPSVMAEDQKEMNSLFDKFNGIAKHLHLDVADGSFVSSHSLDFSLKLSKKFSYNAHLMIKHPERWIVKYGRKVDLCIPQVEEIKNINEYVLWMRSKNKKIAFALNPETKVNILHNFLFDIDCILILTVNPGYYGSKFLKSPLRKIAGIKKINPHIKIIVDGGMTSKTIGFAARAGADYFVSGSFIAKADDSGKAIKELIKGLG